MLQQALGLLKTGQTSEATELLRALIAADSSKPEYHHVLSMALNAQQDQAGAARHLAQAWYGYGCKETAANEFAMALNSFSHALDLEPDWLEARHNLGRALYELGHVSEAFLQFQKCAQMNRPGSEHSRAMMAVIIPGVPEARNAAILAMRKAWAEHDLPKFEATQKTATKSAPIRVGYVSSFFQRDNWMKPVWGLINQHDREKVKVHLFSDCAPTDIRHGYHAHPDDVFVDTSNATNAELAATVEHLQIDVLVDLNGYSNMRRLPLFTRRSAPVVVGWFNMYATTGMEGFDYLIGDAEVLQPGEETDYCEQIIRVSGSYLTFDVNYPVPPVKLRNMEPRALAFGALTSQYKITDQVVAVWSQILNGCPGSTLLIKNKQMASVKTQEHLAARFQKHGVAKERLKLQGPAPHYDFLRAYDDIDIALDTFPYNGGTTTTEAIWQGVPVLTFWGDRWASRTSASILRTAGLGEFVAADLQGYPEMAIRLGNDSGTLARLSGLRKEMRQRLRGSSVCDTANFAKQMEEIYAGLLSST